MMLIGVTYAAILTYLQAFAVERNLVTAASYFLYFMQWPHLTRPIAGRLMDDKNENVVVYPAFIFLIISFAMLMFSFDGWVLLIAGIALGIGYGNLSSSMQAIKSITFNEVRFSYINLFYWFRYRYWLRTIIPRPFHTYDYL